MTPERLALLPVFAGASPETRTAAAAIATVREHAPGSTILARNEQTEHFLFLLEGRWMARRFLVGTDEPLIWSDDRPGSWFSGVTLLDVIAPCDVFADTAAKVLALPRRAFLPIIGADAALARVILADLHAWVRRLDVHGELVRARG